MKDDRLLYAIGQFLSNIGLTILGNKTADDLEFADELIADVERAASRLRLVQEDLSIRGRELVYEKVDDARDSQRCTGYTEAQVAQMVELLLRHRQLFRDIGMPYEAAKIGEVLNEPENTEDDHDAGRG